MAHSLSDLTIPRENAGEINEYITVAPRLQGSERVPQQQSGSPMGPLEQLICGFLDTDTDRLVDTPIISTSPVDSIKQAQQETADPASKQQQASPIDSLAEEGSGKLTDGSTCAAQPSLFGTVHQGRDDNARQSGNEHSIPSRPASNNAGSVTQQQPIVASEPGLATVPKQAALATTAAEASSNPGHTADVTVKIGTCANGIDRTVELRVNHSKETAISSHKTTQAGINSVCNGSPRSQPAKSTTTQITRQGSAVAYMPNSNHEDVKQDASKYPRLACIPHLLPRQATASQGSHQVSNTAIQGRAVSVKVENEAASADSKPVVVTSMQQTAIQANSQQHSGGMVQQASSSNEGKHPAAVERYMRLLKEKKIKPIVAAAAQPKTSTAVYPIAVAGQQSTSTQPASTVTGTHSAQAKVQLPASWQGMPLINQNQNFAPAPQPVRTLFNRGKGAGKGGSGQLRHRRQHQHGAENGGPDAGGRQPVKLSDAERLQRARDVMVMLGRQKPTDSPKPGVSPQHQTSSQDVNDNDGNTSGGSAQQPHITRIGQTSGSFPTASRRIHTGGMLYGAGKSLLGEKRRKREALNVDTNNIVDNDHRSMRQARNSPALIYSPDAFQKKPWSRHGHGAKERGHSSGRRGRQPASVEGGDPAAAETYVPMYQRAKAQLALMRREEHLVQTYRADGWKGRSRERVQLTNDLKRALASMQRRANAIRECVRACEEAHGLKCIPDEYFDEEGELDANYIFCAVCDVDDCDEENDIILCDGNCRRAFHCRCVKPNIGPKELEADEWLCPACDYKTAILGEINADFDTDYTIDTPWQDVLATDPNKSSSQALLTAAWLHLDGHVSTQHAQHAAIDADGKPTAIKGRNVPRAARNRTTPDPDQNGHDPLLDVLDEDESDEDYVEGMSDKEENGKKRSEAGSESGSGGDDDEGESGSHCGDDSDGDSGSGSGSDLGFDLSEEDLGEDDDDSGQDDQSENDNEGEHAQEDTSQGDPEDSEHPQPKRTRIELKPIRTSQSHDTDEDSGSMAVTRKRRARKEVDYVKLHQELFGPAVEEANGEVNNSRKRRKRGRGKQPVDHVSSEDEDYDPELGSP